MSTQKQLFIWQSALIIIFLAVTYIFRHIQLFDFIDFMGLYLIFLLAIILFIPMEILYLMRLKKRGDLAVLNKVFKIVCYTLLIPLIYPIFLFFYVYACNFWDKFLYIPDGGNESMIFFLNRWMLHAPAYMAIYFLLISLLLGMILINKKLDSKNSK